MNDWFERLLNKSSLCVLAASLTQTLPVLSVQRRQGGSGTTAHVSSMLSGFPPSISRPLKLCSAMLKTKGEGLLRAPAMLWPIRGVSTPCLVPSRLCRPLPPPLDTPGKGRKKKKTVHEKQLLGFAFSRTPAETVSVCVCVGRSLSCQISSALQHQHRPWTKGSRRPRQRNSGTGAGPAACRDCTSQGGTYTGIQPSWVETRLWLPVCPSANKDTLKLVLSFTFPFILARPSALQHSDVLPHPPPVGRDVRWWLPFAHWPGLLQLLPGLGQRLHWRHVHQPVPRPGERRGPSSEPLQPQRQPLPPAPQPADVPQPEHGQAEQHHEAGLPGIGGEGPLFPPQRGHLQQQHWPDHAVNSALLPQVCCCPPISDDWVEKSLSLTQRRPLKLLFSPPTSTSSFSPPETAVLFKWSRWLMETNQGFWISRFLDSFKKADESS